jgi:arylsulfatase A-like enzyme
VVRYAPEEWAGRLDSPDTTLAEALAARGYQTAGFAANTTWCSYACRLDRGFARYEDYVLSPTTLLASSKIGRWVVAQAVGLRNAYTIKWTLKYQAREAKGINRAFLDWLARRRPDRPFFAFLNYMDAHDPRVLPEGARTHFGLRPGSPGEIDLLLQYAALDKRMLGPRDNALANDAYDDCIAYLDEQIGALLNELDRLGVLRDTTVVITSDHGEELGEHNLFGHNVSLYRQEVQVPLVIVGPTAPAGWVVAEAVSLRDVAATVVDLAGLSAEVTLPGRSLATHWGPSGAATSPALSDHSNKPVLDPLQGLGPTQRGFTMSLIVGARHYIRDGASDEELYDLDADPRERTNLAGAPAEAAALAGARRALLRILDENPDAAGVARGYLETYRAWLEQEVGGRSLAGRSPGHPER